MNAVAPPKTSQSIKISG